MKKQLSDIQQELDRLKKSQQDSTRQTQQQTQSTKAEAQAFDELGIQLIAASDELRKATARLNELNKATDNGRKATNAENAERSNLVRTIQTQRNSISTLNTEMRNQTKQSAAAVGSIANMRAELNRLYLAYDNMSKARREGIVGQNTLKSIEKLRAEIAALEGQTGRFKREVGHYATAFSPLSFQVQQVARELPSLTISAQQFFLAISNNLPMLADELSRARREYKNLKAEGKDGVPVWKQLLKSIASWQTLLVVGITAVTAYGKEIGKFFSQLFGGTPKMRTMTQMFGDVNKAISSSAKPLAENIVRYRELQREWNNLKGKADEQLTWIKENQTEFGNLGVAINDANDAQIAFVSNSDAMITALREQARAAAARNLAVAQNEKIIQKELELADAQKVLERTQGLINSGRLSTEPLIVGGEVTQSEYEAYKQRERMEQDVVTSLKSELAVLQGVADGYFEIQAAAEDASKAAIKGAGLTPFDTNKAEEKLRKEEERKRKAEEAAARRKQTRADKEARAAERQEKYSFDAAKKSEQLQIDAMQEGYAKRRATIEFNAKWEEAELERRYNKIEGFAEGDADLWKDYAYAVLANEKAKNDALIELDNQYAIETRQILQDNLDARLKYIRSGSEEEYRLRMESLRNMAELDKLQARKEGKLTLDRELDIDLNATYSEGQSAIDVTQSMFGRGMDRNDRSYALQMSRIDASGMTERDKYVAQLNAEKAYWEERLRLAREYGGLLTAEDLEIAQNTIKAIEIEKEKAKRPRDFWDVVGINLDDEKKQAISESVSFALEQMTAILDAEIEMAQQAVDAANERVTAAQSALDAEMQAKANGLAYSQTEAEKRLAMEKQNQAKAIAEQKKAQKQKAQIETLQQISSLVTASAAIWGALVLPWLAIPAIAIMWATFGAAKIKASQLAKSSNGTEQYGDGTYEFIDGGSHQSGNDVPLGINPKTGKERRVEGGEMFAVVNKAGVRKYRSELPAIINSLNRGEFDRTYIRAAFAAPPTPVVVNAMGDNRKMADDIAAIRRLSERQVYTDAKGRTVIRYKNLTRKIN
uniref:hypothetical protein n=1 Tax=Alistipes onderdonkii TaxID=328813 RepID=UPI0040297755